MKKKPIKAVVWDLDGTLIHFKIDFIKARRSAIDILKDHGIPKEELSIKKSILENVASARALMEDEGTMPEDIENLIKKVDEAVIAIETQAAVKATPLRGINLVLEHIREKQFARRRLMMLGFFHHLLSPNKPCSEGLVDHPHPPLCIPFDLP